MTGCSGGRDSIEWKDAVPAPAALAAGGDLSFDAQARLTPKSPPLIAAPVFAAQCRESARVAGDGGGTWYAVWWSLREDSTADLVMSRSDSGAAWTPPRRVDTTDVAAVACRRPPPSIDADHGNVHVAYAMAAREGPGIFASHSMDRGMTFHSPVAVVYGERIGLTSIAARGDIVAVAYEDPNSEPQRIGVAFSRTLGHTFEQRELVSPPTGGAKDPRVAVGDGRIAVTWRRDVAAAASAPRMLREGTIR